MTAATPKSPKRTKLLASLLAAGVAGAAVTGAVVGNTGPVFAEPVRVESPMQNFGFADVVEKVSPAVVSVRVKSSVAPAQFDGGDGQATPFDNLPPDHPLRRFFDFGQPGQANPFGAPDRGQNQRPRQMMGQGSGFFISDDGYLVTNNHVVQDGSEFTVVMDDGTEYDAKLIGTDARTDLAVLKVDAANHKFTYVEFGDDSQVRVGEWVVAVGNPFGLGGSVTAGIVSARGRDIGAGPYDDFLQIDAAVNRGNSGGPDFNLQGQVIGINTAIFSPSGGNVGIAFAIPASTAKTVVDQLIKDGTVQRGWLGVQIGEVNKDIAEAVGLPAAGGAIVTLPDNETPATRAGIQTGDVITKVNGQEVKGPRELARTIGNYQPDETVNVTVWRDGAERNVDVKLGNLASLDEAASANGQPSRRVPTDPSTLSGYGFSVTPSKDGNGVAVGEVKEDSEAADRGIQTGDVIVSVNGTAVNSKADIERALKAASDAGRNAALLQLKSSEGNRFVALPIERG